MAKAGMLLETSAENLAEFKRDELKAHQDLFHVIKQRDPEMSRKAMIDHITHSETLIVGALKRAAEVERAALDAANAGV
jgi:DNA-binding FadR family transcriptional regulator